MSQPTKTFADIDATNITEEVLERSKRMPVVLDFWATWCEPCRVLGPMLEELALEEPGRFFLAKVDVDKNPELAEMFRVQQVPMVVALRDGKLVDGFAGAQSPEFLRDFIDRLAPSGGAGDDRVTAALDLAATGDAEGAMTALGALVEEDSGNDDARVALARLLLDDERVDEATDVLAPVEIDETSPDEWQAVVRRLQLASAGGDVRELRAKVEADPDDLGARIELGKTLAARGQSEEGLDHLLEVVERDKSFGDGAARKAMIEVFEALGEEDPVVGEYRRRLQMLLF